MKVAGLKYDETALRLAMCHSQETAQTFYLRQDMTEVAARATLIIAQCTNLGHVAAAGAPPPATSMDAENDGLTNPEVSPPLKWGTEHMLSSEKKNNNNNKKKFLFFEKKKTKRSSFFSQLLSRQYRTVVKVVGQLWSGS